ncbi:MAG: flagellar FlbD family protein [Treponema sp.]
MVEVTRLNGSKYWINPHQIETVECNPDVTIRMLSGKSFVVKETPEQLIDAVVAYRQRIGMFKNEL